MWDELITFDTNLFLALNSSHSPFFDLLMLWVSGIYTWIPLYVCIIFMVWRAFPKRMALYAMLYMLLSAGLADVVTSGIMKPYFARPRPCHNLVLADLMQLVGDCGGAFGFASSHAANSFALFGSLLFLFPSRKIFVNLMGGWAILISYSRIYLGVHYPSDVVAGALTGLFLSFILSKLFQKFINSNTNTSE